MGNPEGLSVVTVGQRCLSCIKLQTNNCPYGNHLRIDPSTKNYLTTTFVGDPGTNKCYYYEPIPEEIEIMSLNSKKITKTAEKMRDSELNSELYRKIMSMSELDRKKFISYWDFYDKDYSKEMADDVVGKKKKKIKKKEKSKKNKKNE